MRTALLALLLAGLAWAEPIPYVLQAFPPETTLQRAADAPGGRMPIGPFFQSEWFAGKGSLTVFASAEGYQEQLLVIYPENLASGVTVSLRPLSFWTGLRDHLRVRPALGLLLLVPLGAALCLGWLVLAARRGRRAAATQLSALQAFQAELEGDSSDPYLGKTFGPYTLTRCLGVGGMGFVYRAVGPEGEVALKLIRPEFSQEQEFRDRFWREITLAGKLNHRGIVKILACDVQDDMLYYAMELISGRELTIPPDGMPSEQALALLLPAIEALEHAHKAGIVHRDLKPSNILVDDTGRVMLMDFGLAKSPDSPPLTATGAALGTPAYMAPEQIMGRLDKRSDQYALGIILYELLCGRRPFLETDISVIWKHVSEEIPSPRSFRPDIPVEVEAVVMRMLAKEPNDRFEELEDVRLALTRIL